MNGELVLANARIVAAEEVLHGAVLVRHGRIAALEPGRRVPAGAIDLEGDLLLPGLVELHTDNLEKHLSPRPKVLWPILPSLAAHDAELATAGITTVLDAVRVGDSTILGGNAGRAAPLVETIAATRAAGRLRADHLIHLRCELECADAADEFDRIGTDPLVRLVSLMDHTPGQRQFTDVEQWRIYYRGKYRMSEAEIDALMAERLEAQALYSAPNQERIVAACRARGVALATHDDTTAAHVDEAVALGVGISEFPTTFEAAEAAKRHGLGTIAGAPNVVRGKSHSGNVAALDLAARGYLDALSSDYVPASLLLAAFELHRRLEFPLPDAVAVVSRTPARMIGLDDRGAIAPGLRADLVRVALHEEVPLAVQVWREGERIA